MPTTKSVRYTISSDALEADLKLLPAILPIQIFYVFGALTVLTPTEVHAYRSVGVLHPGGSYYFVEAHHAHPFDEIFGSIEQISA
jgi:hypothetical protein